MTRRDLWKAPTENGGLLIDPPLERVPELLETNRRRLGDAKVELLGQPLREFRHKLQDALAVVCDSAASPMREKRPKWPIAPVIATGHQPELFHPGVWIKNFAANGLARRHGLAPLHVVVDADIIKTTSLQIPIANANPALVTTAPVPFDAWNGEEPLLGREIRDPARFHDFATSTQHHWREWPFSPLLPVFWSEVNRCHDAAKSRLAEKWWNEDDSPSLAWCLSGAQRAMEERWGCFNRERWLCHMDRQPFMGQILADLPRFHTAYNESVRQYRRKYRLRGHSHPVPDLAIDGDFFEAPFWWVDSERNRRNRLFVRARGDRLDLRVGFDGQSIVVPRRSPFSSREMADKGAQLTTRALTTTMFVRLCVVDLLIHGIGGAKYDEVTDNIIRQYFGIEPPEYMVVSGTLRLPFPTFPAKTDDCMHLQRQLRNLDWNPERCLPRGQPWVEELVAAKMHWRQAEPTSKAARRERFRQLQAVNGNLRALIPSETVQQLQDSLSRCQQELRANEILQRRDFAFVLYPEETLKQFCTQIL